MIRPDAARQRCCGRCGRIVNGIIGDATGLAGSAAVIWCSLRLEHSVRDQAAPSWNGRPLEGLRFSKIGFASDSGRPIIFHPRSVTFSYPEVKGITVGVDSPYNPWRMEDAWLGT
jgi:hypothetical protein